MNYESEKIKKAYDEFASRYAVLNENMLLQFQLFEFLSFLNKKSKILDAGCGAGRDCEMLYEEGYNITGIDFSKNMITESKKRVTDVKFKVMDFLNTDFKDKSINAIWCNASIIHLPKNKINNALKEFHRILGSESLLFLNVIKGEGEKETEIKKFYNGKLPVSFYQKDEITEILEENGFRIIRSYEESDDNFEWIDLLCKKRI